MTSDLQKAQDVLSAVETQRNELANRLAYAMADLVAARRRIAELEKRSGNVIDMQRQDGQNHSAA